MTANPALSILNSNLKTCRWKEIYIRAYLLNQNWNKGRYTAIHMLRGHNQRVVSLSCDGKESIYYIYTTVSINYCNIVVSSLHLILTSTFFLLYRTVAIRCNNFNFICNS